MQSNGELKNGTKKRRRRNTNPRDSLEEEKCNGRNVAVRLTAAIRTVDEIVIGVKVPRRIRSPSMKRLNANLIFRKAEFGGLSHRRRFLLAGVAKSVGSKAKVQGGGGGGGDCSSVQEDVENEVVEALFDLMNQSYLEDCKSKKNETDSVCTLGIDEERVKKKKWIKTSHLANKSDLIGRNDKMVDKGMGVAVRNDDLIGIEPIADLLGRNDKMVDKGMGFSARNDDFIGKESMQLETLLPAPAVNSSVGRKIAFFERGKELFDDSKRIASKKRVVAPQDKEYSLPGNQNSDKQLHSILLEGNSAAEVIETKREAKFEIALMDVASDDSKVVGHHVQMDVASDDNKVVCQDVQMIKIADKVEEKEQEETKVEPSYSRQGYAKLERSASNCSGKSELVEGNKEPNQCKALISGVQKFALPTSLHFPIFGVGCPRGLPHPGYMPPFQMVMPTFPHAPLLSQPRRKRCATHQYIAHNILVHQQLIMNLTTLPATAGPGTTYKAKTDEDVSKGECLGKTTLSAINDKDVEARFGAGKNVNAANNMQLMFQQAFQQIPTSSVLVPGLQHHSLMVPPINQTVETLSARSLNGAVRSSSSSPLVGYNYINFSSKTVSPDMAMFANDANAYPFSTSSTEKQAPAMMPFVNGLYYPSQPFYVSQTQLQQ